MTADADLDALRSTPIPPAAARASALRQPTASDHPAAVTSADADGLVLSMLVGMCHEFGSGVLVPGAGFLLNNRLSGLVTSEARLADLPPGGQPGHRRRSCSSWTTAPGAGHAVSRVKASIDADAVAGLVARERRRPVPDGDPPFGSAAVAGLGGDGGVGCASDPRHEVWAAVR